MELYLLGHKWDSMEGKLNKDLRIVLCFAPGSHNQAFNPFDNLLGKNKSLLARNVEEPSRMKGKRVLGLDSSSLRQDISLFFLHLTDRESKTQRGMVMSRNYGLNLFSFPF